MRLEKPVILVFWTLKSKFGKATKFQTGFFLESGGTVSHYFNTTDIGMTHRAEVGKI